MRRRFAALRCVCLSVLSPNKRAITAYERAGFRIIGEKRNSGYRLGEPANETLMDAVPEDLAQVDSRDVRGFES